MPGNPSRKKIHITHVTFDMRIGGAEQVIQQLVENTSPARYQVSILCLDQTTGPFGKDLMQKGFAVFCLDRQPGFDFSLIKSIHDHIKKHRVDILHCHQYTPYVYGVLGALFTRCHVVFTEHGRFYPDRRKIKRALVNPILSRFTDRITAISRATADALTTYENIHPKKIQVIYNGIQGDRFLNEPGFTEKTLPGLPPNAFVLGTVARLDAIKNQQMMLHALKQIRKTHENVFLLIVGDGPERDSLTQLAGRLDQTERVIFTGFRTDTFRLYSQMDLFLLTSFSEGTAMTLLEAMASGLPCIATHVGGNPEIVLHNETGIIIPNDDIPALSRAVVRLMDDDNLRTDLGKAGKERFTSCFSIRCMMDNYERLYKEMLNDPDHH